MLTQKELETAGVQRGKERYFATLGSAESREREWDTTGGKALFKQDLDKIVIKMRSLRRKCRSLLIEGQSTGRRLGGWEHLLEPFESEVVAYVAYRSVLNYARRSSSARVQYCAYTIGLALATEIRWQEGRRAEAKAARERGQQPPNRIEMMKRRVKTMEPKSVRKWLRKFDDIAEKEWPRSDMFKVGAVVLDALLEAVPEVVQMIEYKQGDKGRLKSMKVLKLTDEFEHRIANVHEQHSLLKPWAFPMVEEPLPWSFKHTEIVGGYHYTQYDFVKVGGGRKHHTKVSDVPQGVLDAVNVIQKTPWKINRSVFDVALASLDGVEGPLPFEPDMDMPDSVSTEAWAKMSREERGAIKAARERVHSHNNRQAAKKLAAYRVIHTVRDLTEYERIYFPHSIDWRGRAYPLPQDLHPQADDFAKAMLTFAEGKPLGDTGLKWLVFHLANCYGMDKGSREEQAEWFNSHSDDIFAVAADPFRSGLEFWSQADEPWQFLAACIEVCEAYAQDNPEDYVSHLPVHIDGSCNGLQHLSAMGLDPVGAKAVNLLPGPRQDIYQIVADKVAGAVSKDIMKSKKDRPASCHKCEEAVCDVCDGPWRSWYRNVTRKTVKRGVMTTPYGLTPIGMRDQLIQDGWVRDLKGDPMSNANYMRDRMQEAISDTIVKGTEIMQWFQDCAEILAENNKGISWVTPMGMRVTQCYRQITGKRVRTLLGNVQFDTNEGGEVAKRKQMLSVAPNIIHSFDAAHMMGSVLMAKDEGFSFSVIHDSFGVHAGDMEAFSRVIRETFADMYRHDYFWAMKNDFQKQGAKYLTEPPERGDLDINQVVEAEYFFA